MPLAVPELDIGQSVYLFVVNATHGDQVGVSRVPLLVSVVLVTGEVRAHCVDWTCGVLHTTSILVYMDTASTKSVRLDADVVDELKMVAARRKTTIKALIEQALYDSLNRLPETKRGKAS